MDFTKSIIGYATHATKEYGGNVNHLLESSEHNHTLCGRRFFLMSTTERDHPILDGERLYICKACLRSYDKKRRSQKDPVQEK